MVRRRPTTVDTVDQVDSVDERLLSGKSCLKPLVYRVHPVHLVHRYP